MSQENLAKFREAVAASPELQARLKAIPTTNAAASSARIAALANEAGYPVTPEELMAVTGLEAELSEEQLDHVAGGRGGLGSLIVSAISPAACEGNYPPKL